MKYLVLMCTILGAAAAQARDFKCTGVYEENKGSEARLQMTGKTISIDGSVVAGDGFPASVSCAATPSDRKDKKYEIYETTDKKCNVSFIKVTKDLYDKGDGFIALVRRSGGDTHDSSGYAYRYYHCDNKAK
jgi:hypothetical protein